MKKKVAKKTTSLQTGVREYVSTQAKNNPSAFINAALRDYRNRQLKRTMATGYRKMAGDRRLSEELLLWDTTLMDGLDDEDRPLQLGGW